MVGDGAIDNLRIAPFLISVPGVIRKSGGFGPKGSWVIRPTFVKSGVVETSSSGESFPPSPDTRLHRKRKELRHVASRSPRPTPDTPDTRSNFLRFGGFSNRVSGKN